MAQTQTWETKTNWAMEKLIPKELAKNNKQTINNPRMENKSEDTPRTKISRFKQSFKASQRILKSKPILEKVVKPQNFQNLHNKIKCHWDNFDLKENGQQHMKTQ